MEESNDIQMTQTNHEIEILLVEDNPNDAELAMRAFRKNKLANNVIRVCDGEEALDYIFARGHLNTVIV